ncbi:MAG: hypothetical protein JWM57_2778, partial [Phycisphaerales bacterium]|nr:hypothetical protein [Phycisphaerales bacterium]
MLRADSYDTTKCPTKVVPVGDANFGADPIDGIHRCSQSNTCRLAAKAREVLSRRKTGFSADRL